MIEKITEEELEFMETWHYPQALVECLFSNFDNLADFNEEKYGELRMYQMPMLSDEPLIDFETTAKYHNLSKKEAFKLRKNVGDIVNFGARKYGKTLCTEKLDVPVSMLHDDSRKCAFSSIDTIHLEVLDEIKDAIESHPILSMWKKRLKGSPKYEFFARNGWRLTGVNMNLDSKSPGRHFYGKHVEKLWIEEASFETEEIYKKRKEALSELGAVLRLSGMTNFTRYSPAGRAFYKPENRNKRINYPQFVNPEWDEEENKNRLEEYGGEDTPNYRIYVGGEVIEDGVSVFDMERIDPCYDKNQTIKRYEIKKELISRFEDLIFVERPTNAERLFMCADIGDGASGATEIIILAEIGNTYQYLYNIVLHSLKNTEQEKIFDWLISKLQPNVVGIDCGDGTGRAIYNYLELKYGTQNLVWYDGSMKVDVGFELDEKNKPKTDNDGNPIFKQEYMSEWSVRRLMHLLYETRVRIPIDYKFDKQINSVISTKGKSTRTIYACVSEIGDHLFDAFKVFSIAQWLKKDFNQTKPMSQDWGVGASSWSA